MNCSLCLSAMDNEVRFVLCCPAFDDLRYEFIESKYFKSHVNFVVTATSYTKRMRLEKSCFVFV